MRVARWGNSLGIRLPKAVVDALHLVDGDEIEIHVVGDRSFQVARKRTKEESLARIRELRGFFPADFTFDRDEANRRD